MAAHSRNVCFLKVYQIQLFVTHLIVKELHDEGGHTAIYANEEVDAGQHHISCAGHTEDEGGWVHHWCDGPPEQSKTGTVRWRQK